MNMTVTHDTSETEIEPSSIEYATEHTIDGRQVHHVRSIENGEIITDCGRGISLESARLLKCHTEQPRGLRGTNICYDCARSYSGGER